MKSQVRTLWNRFVSWINRIFSRGISAEIGTAPDLSSVSEANYPAEFTISKLQFERDLVRRVREIERSLIPASGESRVELEAELAEIARRLSNVEEAFEERKLKVAELTEMLLRESNQVGGDRLQEAIYKLEAGDFSDADNIFANLVAQGELAIEHAARADFGRGAIAEEHGRWTEAAKFYSRAAKLSPSYDALNRAQKMFWRAGELEEAHLYAEKLLSLTEAGDGEAGEARAAALNNLAAVRQSLGQYTNAEQLYREALEINKAILGTEHPSYATHLNNLANLLSAMGRYEEAEPLYRQALSIDELARGTAHPAYATRLNNLAGLLQDVGRYEEAEPLYRQALEIDKVTLGTRHPDYAVSLNNLAGLLSAIGRYQEAEPLYRMALEITDASLGNEHPDFAIRLSNLANLLAGMDRYEEAEPLLDQALRTLQDRLSPDHPRTKEVEANRARFYAEWAAAKGN